MYIFYPELAPTTHVGSYFQSYTVSFVFRCSREGVSDAEAPQQSPKVPGSQPVSFLLRDSHPCAGIRHENLLLRLLPADQEPELSYWS